MSVELTMSPPISSTETTLSAVPMTGHLERISRATGRELMKAIYTSCYCTSYAVTFPVVFLSHLIPGGAPLASGISDGARAALKYVRATRTSREHTNPYENCV